MSAERAPQRHGHQVCKPDGVEWGQESAEIAYISLQCALKGDSKGDTYFNLDICHSSGSSHDCVEFWQVECTKEQLFFIAPAVAKKG
jgi:hypothetical protein